LVANKIDDAQAPVVFDAPLRGKLIEAGQA
jgi:hypothetical protein